jgi:hypothetical protein
VTNPIMAKAMCATCLLACVVQVWSSDVVVDGEVKVKEDVSCRWTGSGEGRTRGLDRGTQRPGD